MSSCWFGIFSL